MTQARDTEGKRVGRAFGLVLRRRRDGLALSQERLAEACSLDRTYVSMLERGVYQPSLAVFLRVADALGVAAPQLMAEVGDELKGG